jgi:shikimate dehydrogenase
MKNIFKKSRCQGINAETKIYCIFGNPVIHSLSPAMQNAAFKEAGINATYLAFETDDIKLAIQAMKALKISGASVTIPHKNEALKHVDYIDPLAKEIGAINTLLNANGKILGYNTDGYGALQSLITNNVRIKGSRILIIGNGGSARAIAFTLLNEGAEITIAGRNTEKILSLVNDLKKKPGSINHIIINDITESYAGQFDIIINTTSIGMSSDVKDIPIPEYLIQKKHTVFDIVYSPHTTRLLEISKKKGCKIIHGIGMLVYQGARQFEIWTGMQAPVSIMQKAVRKQIR